MSCVSFVLGQEQGGFAGNKVTNLTKSDLADVANKQVIANIYEVPAGAMVPRHFHQEMNFIWFLLVNGPLKLREGPSGT